MGALSLVILAGSPEGFFESPIGAVRGTKPAELFGKERERIG